MSAAIDLGCEATWLGFGLRIGLSADDPATLARLLEHVPPGRAVPASGAADRAYTLVRDGGGAVLEADGLRLACGDEARVAAVFEADLQLFVAEMAPEHVFVHAGAVGWRDEAIILPGPSFCGKTTLVAELVRAGATYYSDEYAVLDARGRVHPYAGTLSIRGDSMEPARRCPVEALGGRRGTEALAAALVVITAYRPGARWEPRWLSAGQGALAILGNTVSARRRPAAALDALRAVVLRATVLEGERGDARDTVDSILEAL